MTNTENLKTMLDGCDAIAIDGGRKLVEWEWNTYPDSITDGIVFFTQWDDGSECECGLDAAGIENGVFEDDVFACEDSDGIKTKIRFYHDSP